MNRKVNILLVEDNKADIVLIKKCLGETTSFPYELFVVEDGQAAVDFVQKQEDYSEAPSPDLIILDLNMPKLNGLEVLKKIKVDKVLKVTPTIVLSSSDADSDVSSAYENYANCYIQKPGDLDGLKKVCKQIDEFWLGLVEYPGASRKD